MLNGIRNSVDKLSVGMKFLLRIAYPILTYIIFYFVLHYFFHIGLKTTQLIFIIFWAVVEWQIFLKKPTSS